MGDDPGESGRLSGPARQSLRRLGLLSGIWQQRLAEAGLELTRFLNRFHRSAGIMHVLEDYYRGRYHRAAAQMAMRLSFRLAGRDPNYARKLYFDRRFAFAPDSSPIMTVVVGYRGRHYRLFPWRRLYGRVLRRQARRDKLAYRHPDKVRWAFSTRSISADQRLRRNLRQLLAGTTGRGDRQWADNLSRTAMVI